jgi:hypothetical protein
MLHCYLRVYIYGFILCVFITVCKFMGISYICCMYMFTVIFSMNSCIYKCIFLITFYIYIFHKSSVCICILIACSSKKICGIAQLDVGYVTLCFHRENTRVLWHNVAWHGWPGTLHHPILMVLNIFLEKYWDFRQRETLIYILIWC